MDEVKKFCVDCNTTKTPLWRNGPHGPRSLCNACGIKYRKRKMVEDEQPKLIRSSEIITEKSFNRKGDDFVDAKQIKVALKMGYDYGEMGNKVFLQRSRSSSSSSSPCSKPKKQRSSSEESIRCSNRDYGEVEQAAVLLMSLSCGAVFA